MPKLIDAHTHVQFAAYDNDWKEVIDRSLTQDTWLINVGTQKDTSTKAVEIAEKYGEGVYATIGLHPIHTERSYHDEQELGLPADSAFVATSAKEAASAKEGGKGFDSREEEFSAEGGSASGGDYDYYKKLGENPKVVAIGECGLDYYRLGESTKESQEKAFLAQIKLANELKKPLMIHCRNAYPDLINILNKQKSLLGNPSGIIHFFSGTKEDVSKLLNLGFYFSFGGVITFVRDYDEVIKLIGLERIILETDAPYVTPVPYRGKRNEPSYVKHTAEKLAEIVGKDLKEMAEITTKNAREVLKI